MGSFRGGTNEYSNLVVVIVVDVLREVCVGLGLVLLCPVWHEQLDGDESDVNHGGYQAYPDATGAVEENPVRRQRQVVLPAPTRWVAKTGVGLRHAQEKT